MTTGRGRLLVYRFQSCSIRLFIALRPGFLVGMAHSVRLGMPDYTANRGSKGVTAENGNT